MKAWNSNPTYLKMANFCKVFNAKLMSTGLKTFLIDQDRPCISAPEMAANMQMSTNNNSTNTQRTMRFPYFLETLCPYFEKYASTPVLPTDFPTNMIKYGQVGRPTILWLKVIMSDLKPLTQCGSACNRLHCSASWDQLCMLLGHSPTKKQTLLVLSETVLHSCIYNTIERAPDESAIFVSVEQVPYSPTNYKKKTAIARVWPTIHYEIIFPIFFIKIFNLYTRQWLMKSSSLIFVPEDKMFKSWGMTQTKALKLYYNAESMNKPVSISQEHIESWER